MRIIPEAESAQLVTRELAFAAARDALIAAATDGVTFPAVLCPLREGGERISVKAGVVDGSPGIKIGSFWPQNPTHGLASHGSVILLFDMATGRIDTIIEASQANALRTAAADAVAASVLSRSESETLAVFGSGRQASYEIQALCEVRPIRKIMIVSRKAASADELIAGLRALGFDASDASAEAACRNADIIVTATPSREPLFNPDWVRPGTHVAAMGADGPGKQEIPPALLRRAALFCDLPEQAIALGEFQSVADEVKAGRLKLTPIGQVLRGDHPGRQGSDEITVFDSSGLALQDIALALHITGRLPR